MHELSILCNVIEIAKKYAGEAHMTHIHKVVMHIGEFCAIQQDALYFAFNTLKTEHLLKDAQLIIETSEAKAYCTHCKQDFKVSFTQRQCPICNRLSHQITSGYEILITSIEGD